MTVIDDGQAQAVAQYPIGRPLVEVFWVRIDNIDGEYLGQLYGIIKASDGLSTQTLYDRDKSNYQTVRPGEYAQLIGPSRAISAAGDFLIDLSLYDYDNVSPDDEICKGQVSWNVCDPFKEYDKLHTTQIRGEYGAATINYVVMTDACEALIEVVLINGDGEDPANVYGSITASSGFGERQLFHRSSSDYIDVSPGKPIPLQRNSMAIARTNELRVEADLWVHNTISSDNQIAKGSVIFVSQVATSSKQIITGAYGKVEVRITWY
ncbi:hypothetical protein M422DRAFT_231122 [Sphaerobolus stellatus SS14]|uniref:DUF6598 domain-containing protein n=1 Tax=Sphaerobolus stellatus (strain SS14) TaxID=990650 RepID=A0A0C9VLR7_SPHS4|nr:hypothetical protein M422DRAFT_231122 [Sphaerobolus stellatus SS14]